MSDVLVIEVEGADQDNAMVGFEHTATGMRFEIKGALAKALNAQAAEITRLQALLKEAGEVLGEGSSHQANAWSDAARSLSDRIRGV